MSNMYSGLGGAFDGFSRIMTILLWIFVLLGIWKFMEIIDWIISHIKIVVS